MGDNVIQLINGGVAQGANKANFGFQYDDCGGYYNNNHDCPEQPSIHSWRL